MCYIGALIREERYPMNNMLVKIARAARKEMEDFAENHNDIGSPHDLGCYCAISSYFLRYLARNFGYHLKMVEGAAFEPNDIRYTNHCWLVYNDKVIDITATQFGCQKKVNIVNVGNINYYEIRKSTEDRFSNWPSDQSPITFKNELKRRARRLAEELQIAA